ncbi:hypothetical protein A5761_09820 [Mycolicibacterium setense]|uniref:Zn-ribbon domain-containing OB-fold protein n=1 Tax=Mycolicibacterium setense TaxID=431269 RepID=UPI0007EAD1A3|nr:Zn-ribbon domain-containing OB-fold protein [Mycolicibacterium setense]OBB17645.1 hypothetical protein A5761_09820 [Mycolicibacterium setense]
MSQSELPSPAPEIAQHDAAFWAATSQGRLLAGSCTDCDEWFWPPTREFCPRCGGSISNRQVSGRGTIYSWTVVTRGGGAYKDAGAYVLAYVALEEGPTMLTNIVGTSPESLDVDMPVSLVFTPTDEPSGAALPRFEPAEKSSG